jgi:hypothetical protein
MKEQDHQCNHQAPNYGIGHIDLPQERSGLSGKSTKKEGNQPNQQRGHFIQNYALHGVFYPK